MTCKTVILKPFFSTDSYKFQDTNQLVKAASEMRKKQFHCVWHLYYDLEGKYYVKNNIVDSFINTFNTDNSSSNIKIIYERTELRVRYLKEDVNDFTTDNSYITI